MYNILETFDLEIYSGDQLSANAICVTIEQNACVQFGNCVCVAMAQSMICSKLGCIRRPAHTAQSKLCARISRFFEIFDGIKFEIVRNKATANSMAAATPLPSAFDAHHDAA